MSKDRCCREEHCKCHKEGKHHCCEEERCKCHKESKHHCCEEECCKCHKEGKHHRCEEECCRCHKEKEIKPDLYTGIFENCGNISFIIFLVLVLLIVSGGI